MAKESNGKCGCNVCSIEESPIVAADGMLFRCCIKDNTYIPTQMIDLNELIESLHKQISDMTARRRAASAPVTPTKKENGKRSTFDFNSNISPRSNTRSYSESHTTISRWRDRLGSQGASSIQSLKTMPKSILLKCTDKHKVSNESLTDAFVDVQNKNDINWRKRFTDQLAWVRENGRDFVAMETLRSISEVSALLCVLAENKSPTVVQIKVNCSETITASYHFLDNFKQQFMMLKVSNGYCMFMAPF